MVRLYDEPKTSSSHVTDDPETDLSLSSAMNTSRISTFTVTVLREFRLALMHFSLCLVMSSKCQCQLRIFAAAHTMLVSLIYSVSEESQTHSHKLQRWCSRREWHGSHWGWFLCRNRWRLRSCRESDKIITLNQTDRFGNLSFVRRSYLHVCLMTSITPSYLLCWSCRRARTTWYGYVVATANILDKAAMVIYSSAFCLYTDTKLRKHEGVRNEHSRERKLMTHFFN